MAKRYKTVLSVLLVVLIAVSAVTISGVFDINRIIREKENAPGTVPKTYKDVFASFTDANTPILRTDIDNIYYAMDKEGAVKFYELTAGKLSAVEESGSFEVSASCSSQELPATIHYIERDGKTAGYGLFTNTNHPDIYLYDYAFFRVTNMFKGFASNSKTLLLMLDVDKTRFYQEDKVFSEIFYLYSDHTTEHFLSENQRIVDMNARMRTDYKMFTSSVLNQNGSNILFFSSRFYTAYENSNKLDILTSGGSGENKDNVRYIENVASMHFWRTDEGTYYFSDVDGEHFALNLFDGDESTAVASFEGDIAADYVIDGDYICNKASGEIYNVITKESLKLDYSEIKKNFAPDMLDISDNGEYVIFRGSGLRNRPVCGIMNFKTGKLLSYTDDIFGYAAAIHVQNDGSLLISVATGESASSYYQLTGLAGELVAIDNETTTEA